MLEIQYMLTHWHCAHTHKKSSVIENTGLMCLMFHTIV